MLARSKSEPSTCAGGSSLNADRSSSFISSNPSPEMQCSSLQAVKNQRLQKLSIHRPLLSSHCGKLVLLSLFLLLAQKSDVAQARSIAQLTLSASSSTLQQLQQLQREESPIDSEQGGLQSSDSDFSRSSDKVLQRRKRGIDEPILWPNYTIPFIFQEPFPMRYKNQVRKAMSVWADRTCIAFKDRSDEEYFAKIAISDHTCDSKVGLKRFEIYRNKGQPVRLTINCLKNRGLIMHELGHLIGLYHEHQRPDRNQHIKVLYSNIPPFLHRQFDELDFTTYGDYDFESIMHYPLNFYGSASRPSMQVLSNVTLPEDLVIGALHTLSRGDRVKTKAMYKCPKKKNEPAVEEPSAANVYSGELVSLQISGGSFTADNEWLSCTEQTCRVGTCPGKRLKDDDRTSCPDYVFTLHKVIPPNDTSTRVVRVGDSIVLEHLTLDMFPAGGASREDDRGRLFVSCNSNTHVCSLSSICVGETNRFNASYCRENVLIIRAEGKEVGEPVTHKDLIGFEFEAPHNPDFTEQCALGCDPVTRVCSKKLCVFSNSNDLLSNSLGGGLSNSLGGSPSNSLGGSPSHSGASPTEDPPKCGKDMFFIRKY